MAIFYGNIKSLNSSLSEGELYIIKKIEKELDDSFNIFLKQNINGDKINILILREGAGILIINVLDWKLDNYIYVTGSYAGKYGMIIPKDKYQSKIPFITPFEKLHTYKKNMYKYHLEDLIKKSILDENYMSLVNTAIYFSKEKECDVKSKFSNNTRAMREIKFWGCNSPIVNDIKNILKSNNIFDKELYNKSLKKFKGDIYKNYRGEYITLEKKKRDLMTSKAGANVKIKGIAGSGKTTLLCNRAVLAYKRLNGKGKILILTYNVTLRNYIKEKMKDTLDKFYWNAFDITSFHIFIEQKALEFEIEIKNSTYDETYKLFKCFISENDKYDGIFIDEVQDFKREWLDLLKDIFLKENGEYVLFGDEKQNIYNRVLDNKKRVRTNVKGRWNELTKSYRASTNITILLKEFQREFFIKKYELDNIEIEEQIGLNINDDEITYFFQEKIGYKEIFDKSKIYLDNKNVSYKDTCIIWGNLIELRNMEWYARKKYKLNVERMFETKEEFLLACKRDNYNELIKSLREARQFNFFTKGSGIKMCTTEKFTGWEIENLVFILDENDKNMELIYTAISRCRKNLFIINRGNIQFHEFINKLNI